MLYLEQMTDYSLSANTESSFSKIDMSILVNIKKTNAKVEGTTLGDLGVFSELKDAFNEPAAEKKAPAKKAAAKEEPVAEAPATEEAPAKETKAKATKSKAKASDDKDDLKKIEGIGPKIMEHLNNAGIMTFANLADAKVDDLKQILENAGSRYKMFDPTTWPEQAGIAASGDWDKLKELQDKLDGGKK